MKNFIFLISLITISITAQAQRGTYGTYAPYTVVTGAIYNNALVAKATDTLKGVDTTYIYFTFASAYRTLFTIKTVQKADSLSGTAILQAWAGSTTGWVTRGSPWESITGVTALCTSCVGASKTYSTATGTNYATWDIGQAEFANWRIRIVGSRSTDTTAVTATAQYSY